MRILLIATAALCVAAWSGDADAKGGKSSSREHEVKGHVTKDGKYVAPHHATNPNGTRLDNYSHRGNVNPHTGRVGTKD